MASTLLGDSLETAWDQYTNAWKVSTLFGFYNLLKTAYDPSGEVTEKFLSAAWLLHQRRENQYQEASERFFHAFRLAETGDDFRLPFQNQKSSYASTITNFMIHGPQAIKRKEQLLGVPFSKFTVVQKDESFNHFAGSSMQQVLAAPRANVIDTIKLDPQTSRWTRKPDHGACKFCLLLVSRGPVYTDKTARFSSHGNCACKPIAVYKGYKIPENTKEAVQSWIDENDGKETSARRYRNVQAEVEAGLKKPQTYNYTDKYGRPASRTVYVKTEAAKQVEQAASKKTQDQVDSISRNGKPFKVVDHTPDNVTNIKSVVKELKSSKNARLAA